MGYVLVLIGGILTGMIHSSATRDAYVFYENVAAKNRGEGIICECKPPVPGAGKKWKGVSNGGNCMANGGPNTFGQPYASYGNLHLTVPQNSCCVTAGDTNPDFNGKPKVRGRKSNKRC